MSTDFQICISVPLRKTRKIFKKEPRESTTYSLCEFVFPFSNLFEKGVNQNVEKITTIFD